MKNLKNKSLVLFLVLPLVSCGVDNDKISHNLDNKWLYNENEHWHHCVDEDCCEIFDKENHSFGPITYNWSEDYSKCIASKICTKCNFNLESFGNVSYKITKGSNCLEKGKKTYTSTFNDSWCETQTKTDIEVAALGHELSDVKYKWADYSSCIAIAKCSRDGCDYEEIAEAVITNKVNKEPGCETEGEIIYTATFNKNWCETQTKIKKTSVAGHDFENQEITYTWNADYTKCIAKRKCKNCDYIDETDECEITYEITKKPYKYETGKKLAKAVFSNWAKTENPIIAADIDTDAPFKEAKDLNNFSASLGARDDETRKYSFIKQGNFYVNNIFGQLENKTNLEFFINPTNETYASGGWPGMTLQFYGNSNGGEALLVDSYQFHFFEKDGSIKWYAKNGNSYTDPVNLDYVKIFDTNFNEITNIGTESKKLFFRFDLNSSQIISDAYALQISFWSNNASWEMSDIRISEPCNGENHTLSESVIVSEAGKYSDEYYYKTCELCGERHNFYGEKGHIKNIPLSSGEVIGALTISPTTDENGKEYFNALYKNGLSFANSLANRGENNSLEFELLYNGGNWSSVWKLASIVFKDSSGNSLKSFSIALNHNDIGNGDSGWCPGLNGAFNDGYAWFWNKTTNKNKTDSSNLSQNSGETIGIKFDLNNENIKNATSFDLLLCNDNENFLNKVYAKIALKRSDVKYLSNDTSMHKEKFTITENSDNSETIVKNTSEYNDILKIASIGDLLNAGKHKMKIIVSMDENSAQDWFGLTIFGFDKDLIYNKSKYCNLFNEINTDSDGIVFLDENGNSMSNKKVEHKGDKLVIVVDYSSSLFNGYNYGIGFGFSTANIAITIHSISFN